MSLPVSFIPEPVPPARRIKRGDAPPPPRVAWGDDDEAQKEAETPPLASRGVDRREDDDVASHDAETEKNGDGDQKEGKTDVPSSVIEVDLPPECDSEAVVVLPPTERTSTVKELRQMCADRNLSDKGKKADLVARIRQCDEQRSPTARSLSDG